MSTNNNVIYKFLLIIALVCLLTPYTQSLFYVSAANIILVVFFSLVLFYKVKTENEFKFIGKLSKTRIPWIDRIIKYRYTLFLFFLLVLGFVVRIINLTALEPYTDEYIHLMYAQSINGHGVTNIYTDGQFNELYMRGYFLTYLVSIIFKFFGESLFNARLPGIIISTLTIIPMYFIGKKIANRQVGLITATLWAFLPWGIMISRNVREYAYFPLFYALTFLLFISFYENIKRYLENRAINSSFYDVLPQVILLCLPVLYAFVLDTGSTFKQISIFYVASFLFLSYSLLLNIDINKIVKRVVFVFTLVILTAGAFIFLNYEIPHLSQQPQLNKNWIINLFSSVGMVAMFFIASIAAIFYFNKRNHYPFLGFILFVFLLYLYFYGFHLTRYFRPRYEFALMVWLLPILAFGMYIVIKLITPTKIYAKILLTCLLLVLVINPKQFYVALNHKQHGYVPMTVEYHDQYLPVLKKYRAVIKPKTPIICSLCGPFYWHRQVKHTDNHIYRYIQSDLERFEKIQKNMSKYKTGWIFLDSRRNGRWNKGLPSKDFKLGNVKIHFIERLSGFYIYKWYS